MRPQRVKPWGYAALLASVGLAGCVDYSKYENIAVEPVEPTLVAPLVKSTITFKEMVERNDANSFVYQKAGSNLLYIAFRDTIDIGKAASEFAVQPLALTNTFQLAGGEIPAPVPAGQTVGPITRAFSETYTVVDNASIKRILISQGRLTYRITNRFSSFSIASGSEIVLTSLKNGQGQPYVIPISGDIAPGGQGPSGFEDIAGFSLDLQQGTNYNAFQTLAKVVLRSVNGSPATTTDYVAVDITLNSLDYSYIQGKINKSINIDDYDYKVDIFRSTYVADQHFDDPRFTLKILNSYGIPTSLTIKGIEAKNVRSGQLLAIANSGTPTANTLKIGSSNTLSIMSTMGSAPAKDSLVLNRDNSNVADAFNLAPNQFKFRSQVTLGNATNNHDYFATKDSRISIVSEIELPLIGWIETNQINDTIADLNLPDLESELNLKQSDPLEVTLKFRFRSGMPLNTYVQASFLNDANQLLTTLFAEELLLVKSAAIDPATGKATTPTTNDTQIVINRNKYRLMKEAKKVILHYRFKTGSSSTNQSVRIESDNFIDAQLSIKATAKVNLD